VRLSTFTTRLTANKLAVRSRAVQSICSQTAAQLSCAGRVAVAGDDLQRAAGATLLGATGGPKNPIRLSSRAATQLGNAYAACLCSSVCCMIARGAPLMVIAGGGLACRTVRILHRATGISGGAAPLEPSPVLPCGC
jgi:hypothetical protein